MLSITDTTADVDSNHAANIDSSLPGSLKTSNDPQKLPGADSTEKKPWDALKETTSFRQLLEADGHRFVGTGSWPKCRCPFHDDRTPSFTVNAEDTHGKCYGCDWYGNIFDYEMEAHQVDFREALRRLEGKAPRVTKTATEAKQVLKPGSYKVSTKHQEVRATYSKRLSTDEWLRSWICEKRAQGGNQWNPDTLKNLAAEGSLGWAGDAFSFHYRTGTKYREFPGRRMKWDECNIGISMWREERIEGAQTIYITEGETDAITLVDLGLEEDPSVAIIAIQGATSFQSGWRVRFRDKVVILCFDCDAAGEKAFESVGSAMTGVAAQVLTINVKEVAQ